MNNSKLISDSIKFQNDEMHEVLRFKDLEPKVIRKLEAIRELQRSAAWSSLKELEFDTLTESLNNLILSEAKKQNPDTNKLNRLVGELKWAERFADLNKWENQLQVELQIIRMNLYGKTKKES